MVSNKNSVLESFKQYLREKQPCVYKFLKYLKLVFYLYRVKLISLTNGWYRHNKIEIINFILQEIKDEPIIYKKEEIATYKNKPASEIELFMISQIPQVQNIFNFDDVDEIDCGILSVFHSILCLREEIRTKKFLLAIKNAIKELEQQQNQIHVLDAGCGALPILGLYAALCSDKVRCTCLELNPYSYQIAQTIIKNFNLENRINVLHQDARKYIVHEKPNLLISETMYVGLFKEPLVQIMDNLVPQLVSNAITLPKKVIVKAALVPVDEFTDPSHFVTICQDPVPYIKTKWTKVVDYKAGSTLPNITFTLPTDELLEGNYCALVASDLDLESQYIDGYDSLITRPTALFEKKLNSDDTQMWKFKLEKENIGKKSVHISYNPGGSMLGTARLVSEVVA